MHSEARSPKRGASTEVPWERRSARHLLNRAGFGASSHRVERALDEGWERTVQRLLRPRKPDPFPAQPITWAVDKRVLAQMGPDALRRGRADMRKRDREQSAAYLEHWMGRLLENVDPLRERMTLFWHGLFTSQASKVKESYLLIRQSELIRREALGNYGELLRAMLRDPAMLRYLDNASNIRAHPVENLARELMELFSLGEGNYTEEDVIEAARALTGYGLDGRAEFTFERKQHDFGVKTILGVTQRHDLDSLVDTLLAQPACGHYIAGRILTYLEGTPPDPARRADYGDFLRGRNYRIAPLLERLFADPAFYRPEVLEARILSPIDFLVGHCRRAGLRPDARHLVQAAGLLGEQLFEPPGVKGWEGGWGWITTSTLLARGNLAGALLGLGEQPPSSEPAADPAEMESMMMGSSESGAKSSERADRMGKVLRLLRAEGRKEAPTLLRRLARRRPADERALVDGMLELLLAIDVPGSSRERFRAFLSQERTRLSIGMDELFEERGNLLLRRLMHLMLSSPEAQLA